MSTDGVIVAVAMTGTFIGLVIALIRAANRNPSDEKSNRMNVVFIASLLGWLGYWSTVFAASMVFGMADSRDASLDTFSGVLVIGWWSAPLLMIAGLLTRRMRRRLALLEHGASARGCVLGTKETAIYAKGRSKAVLYEFQGPDGILRQGIGDRTCAHGFLDER